CCPGRSASTATPDRFRNPGPLPPNTDKACYTYRPRVDGLRVRNPCQSLPPAQAPMLIAKFAPGGQVCQPNSVGLDAKTLRSKRSRQPATPVVQRTPPSIHTVSPVIQLASSDSRNPANRPVSSMVPSRRIG